MKRVLASVCLAACLGAAALAQSPSHIVSPRGPIQMGSATNGVWAITNDGMTACYMQMFEVHYSNTANGAASLVLIRPGTAATSTLFSTSYTTATHVAYFPNGYEYWLQPSNIIKYTDTTTNNSGLIMFTLEY